MIQKKMLVVDDDADIREMITTFLPEKGTWFAVHAMVKRDCSW